MSWFSWRPQSQSFCSGSSVPRRSTVSPTQFQTVTSVACRFRPLVAVTCLFTQPAESRIQAAMLECLFFAKNRLLQLNILHILALGVLVTALSTRQSCVLYKLAVVQLVNEFPAFYAIRGFMIVFRGVRHSCGSTGRPIVIHSSYKVRAMNAHAGV